MNLSVPGPLVLLGSDALRPDSLDIWRWITSITPGGIEDSIILPCALSGKKTGIPEGRTAFMEETLNAAGFPTRTRMLLSAEQANDPAWLDGFGTTSALILASGEPDALCHVLAETEAWRLILENHRSGAALIAVGGAASTFGEWAYVVREPAPDTLDELGFEPRPALGLIPGVVVLPYFDRLQAAVYKKIVDLWEPGVPLIGIDSLSALAFTPDGWLTFGQGTVTIRKQNGYVFTIHAGDPVPAGILNPPYAGL